MISIFVYWEIENTKTQKRFMFSRSSSEDINKLFMINTKTMKKNGPCGQIRRSCSTGHIVGGGEPSYSYKDEKYDDFDRFISNLLNAD